MDTVRGNSETLRLKSNIEDQLNRLLTQLQDLEDNREDFDEEEYEENRSSFFLSFFLLSTFFHLIFDLIEEILSNKWKNLKLV